MSTIAFTNNDIFGQGLSKIGRDDICIINRLINEGVLNFNGSLNYSTDKKDIWTYIRYIAFNNPDVFIGQQTALVLITSVLMFIDNTLPVTIDTAMQLTTNNLTDFINHIILSNKDVIKIPALTNLLNKIIQTMNPNINTSVASANTNSTNSSANASKRMSMPLSVNNNGVMEHSLAEVVIDADGKMDVSIKL
jgi:hypothetical protein